MINVCERCGKHFNARVFAKWCVECRPIIYSDYHARWRKARREHIKAQKHRHYMANRDACIEKAKLAYRKRKERTS